MYKYKRKTYDTWDICKNYGYGDGLEVVCTEDNYKDAKMNIKLYRENEGGSFKLIKRRVKINLEVK